MPYVNIQVTAGVTREQKARLVAEITRSLRTILDKKPEHTHIVIHEIAEENWGFAGVLTDEWRSQQVHQRAEQAGIDPPAALGKVTDTNTSKPNAKANDTTDAA